MAGPFRTLGGLGAISGPPTLWSGREAAAFERLLEFLEVVLEEAAGVGAHEGRDGVRERAAGRIVLQRDVDARAAAGRRESHGAGVPYDRDGTRGPGTETRSMSC